MRGRNIVFASALAALALVVAAGASGRVSKTLHYRALSGSATATLVFHREDTNSSADGTAILKAVRKRTAKGTLAARSGRILFPIKGTRTERIKTLSRESETAPYQEQNCSKSRKATGRGGLTLRRVGKEVEVRWAFPQAKFGFCPGVQVTAAVKGLMTKRFPASTFTAKRATLSFSGEKQVKLAEHEFLRYTWRASVRIARTKK